jgi:hypothetical protein
MSKKDKLIERKAHEFDNAMKHIAYVDAVTAMAAAADWNNVHGGNQRIARAELIDNDWCVGIYTLTIEKFLSPPDEDRKPHPKKDGPHHHY